jgi:hypothetical protein
MAKTQGKTSGVKTTARGGARKSAGAKIAAHRRRSDAGGGSGNSPGRESRTTKGRPEAESRRRGPGGMGKEVGRQQSGAGARRVSRG